MVILPDVDVHQQRLATSRCTPVGQLVELCPRVTRCSERCDRSAVGARLVVPFDLKVQRIAQRNRVGEVPVEVDLGEQQRQILEVLPYDRRLRLRHPLGVDRQCVADDVVVVLQQGRHRQCAERVELRRQRVMHATDVVLVESFEAVIP